MRHVDALAGVIEGDLVEFQMLQLPRMLDQSDEFGSADRLITFEALQAYQNRLQDSLVHVLRVECPGEAAMIGKLVRVVPPVTGVDAVGDHKLIGQNVVDSVSEMPADQSEDLPLGQIKIAKDHCQYLDWEKWHFASGRRWLVHFQLILG